MTKLRTTKAVKTTRDDRDQLNAWVKASKVAINHNRFWSDADTIAEPDGAGGVRYTPVWTANVQVMRDRLKLMQDVANKFFTRSTRALSLAATFTEQEKADIIRFGVALCPSNNHQQLRVLKGILSAMPYLEVFPINTGASHLNTLSHSPFTDPYNLSFGIDDVNSDKYPTEHLLYSHRRRAEFAFVHKGCDMPSGTIYLLDSGFEISSPLLNQRERSSSAYTQNPERALSLCRKHFKYEPPKKLRQYHFFRELVSETDNHTNKLRRESTHKYHKLLDAVETLLGKDNTPDELPLIQHLFRANIDSVQAVRQDMLDDIEAYLDSMLATRQMCWLQMLPDQQMAYVLLNYSEYTKAGAHDPKGIATMLKGLLLSPGFVDDPQIGRLVDKLARLNPPAAEPKEWHPSSPMFSHELLDGLSPVYTEPVEQMPPELMAKIAELSLRDTKQDFVTDIGFAVSHTEFIVYVSDIFNILSEGEADA